ncbi:50S ribosomal protein L9 [Candidatus Kaiserbacteria bacterium RIFCSPLOWO2_01_FULL_52_12b]|uniref:Large ribosomal subunit protein bL9 n=1 Tax=Candidatus Kaiserbacteria bacterium RIFCSPLOWO2_01_FULL_52_12b TaxID=1798509 RepID=A0A1F6EXB2_9BACT|nr:MAG: 50S ribosomal protein L9 [Candidatus Kaiserbacteria bacterium RIFCSPLOWO2_01_FULL_52_12b]
MKIILLKEVKGIGRAHEEVVAADGYALNYLIPKKLAIPATPVAMKDAEMRRRQAAEHKEVTAKLIAQNIADLAEAHIIIKAKANEKGHLYDAVGEPEIRTAAKEQAHIDVPENSIKLDKSIKELGTFDVPISAGEVFGKFSIAIEAE